LMFILIIEKKHVARQPAFEVFSSMCAQIKCMVNKFGNFCVNYQLAATSL
jgi:hypothetical protein